MVRVPFNLPAPLNLCTFHFCLLFSSLSEYRIKRTVPCCSFFLYCQRADNRKPEKGTHETSGQSFFPIFSSFFFLPSRHTRLLRAMATAVKNSSFVITRRKRARETSRRYLDDPVVYRRPISKFFVVVVVITVQ